MTLGAGSKAVRAESVAGPLPLPTSQMVPLVGDREGERASRLGNTGSARVTLPRPTSHLKMSGGWAGERDGTDSARSESEAHFTFTRAANYNSFPGVAPRLTPGYSALRVGV